MSSLLPICVTGIVLGAFALLFFVFGRPKMSDQTELVRRLYGNQLEPLMPYVQEGSERQFSDDFLFWENSHGVRGNLKRLYNCLIFLRLLHCFYGSEDVTREEANRVWRFGMLQIWFSIVAIPESMICSLFPAIPHINARMGLNFYSALVIEVATLLQFSSDELLIL